MGNTEVISLSSKSKLSSPIQILEAFLTLLMLLSSKFNFILSCCSSFSSTITCAVVMMLLLSKMMYRDIFSTFASSTNDVYHFIV